MAEGERPPNDTIATLGPKGAKARFGVAYLRSVCSQAGVGFKETSPDEDVRAIDGEIDFDVAPAAVQVKCTGKFKIDGGRTATWPADVVWRKKWNKIKIPVYFVLVLVDPDIQANWLEHRNDGTMQHAAAFWVRVNQLTGDSVTVPKSQRLTAETLNEWAEDVTACFTAGGSGLNAE